MTVAAANNQVDEGGAALWDATAANKTKILIDKIEFNRDMHYGGVLNLNNTVAGEPNWEVLDSYRQNPFAIDEPGSGHADLEEDLAYKAAYDTDPTEAWTKEGVTTTRKSVFGMHGAVDDYLLLIPEATAPVGTTTITITYHVMTQDANLPNGMSNIKNVITKEIPSSLQLEKGKSYNFHLNLGVHSVDLDVDVEDWISVSESETYLPKNK